MENTMRVRRAQLDLIQLQVVQRLAKNGLTMGAPRYSVIENGHVDPTPDERAALARVLETTEAALFPGLDAASTPSSSEAVQR
jgi:hypothetical protein